MIGSAHTVHDSFAKFSKEQGWQQVAKEVVPLGTTDCSSALLNIANSGADVLVNIAFGGDAVAFTKQAELKSGLASRRRPASSYKSIASQAVSCLAD